MLNHLLDRMGMSLSVLCLIHCLAFPFFILFVPSMDWLFTNETLVHWILLGLALPVSLVAFGHGLRYHGDWLTLILGGLGLLLLIVGVSHLLGHESEFYLTVPGAFILFVAHVRNWRHHLGHGGHKKGHQGHEHSKSKLNSH